MHIYSKTESPNSYATKYNLYNVIIYIVGNTVLALGVFGFAEPLVSRIYSFCIIALMPLFYWIHLRFKKHSINKESIRNQEFKQILDAIPDLVFLKGPQSKLVWANKAFCNCLGMTAEQLTGIIDAPFSEPDVTEQYVKDDAFVFNNGVVLEIPEEPIKHHTGEVRYANTVKVPIFNDEKKVIMTVGISRDITERKRQEEELNEQRVRLISSSKMSALGEMCAGIAHEINNPLAIIHSRASQLKEIALEDEALSLEFVAQTAEKIEQTAIRISKIIKSLKSFTRNAEQDPYERVPIVNIINDTVELCFERFRSKNVKFILKDFDQNLVLECQAVQISQVILNLFNNSCDAIEDLSEKWISVGIKAENNFLEISVDDSGKGIPKELATKIMNPFFTTKEPGKGTGLGLSLSKGIIESHQGELSIDFTNDHTSFIIKIPQFKKRSAQGENAA